MVHQVARRTSGVATLGNLGPQCEHSSQISKPSEEFTLSLVQMTAHAFADDSYYRETREIGNDMVRQMLGSRPIIDLAYTNHTDFPQRAFAMMDINKSLSERTVPFHQYVVDGSKSKSAPVTVSTR